MNVCICDVCNLFRSEVAIAFSDSQRLQSGDRFHSSPNLGRQMRNNWFEEGADDAALDYIR
jgi:hypothetical protein